MVIIVGFKMLRLFLGAGLAPPGEASPGKLSVPGDKVSPPELR